MSGCWVKDIINHSIQRSVVNLFWWQSADCWSNWNQLKLISEGGRIVCACYANYAGDITWKTFNCNHNSIFHSLGHCAFFFFNRKISSFYYDYNWSLKRCQRMQWEAGTDECRKKDSILRTQLGSHSIISREMKATTGNDVDMTSTTILIFLSLRNFHD